jgi:hypothetical protein
MANAAEWNSIVTDAISAIDNKRTDFIKRPSSV